MDGTSADQCNLAAALKDLDLSVSLEKEEASHVSSFAQSPTIDQELQMMMADIDIVRTTAYDLAALVSFSFNEGL